MPAQIAGSSLMERISGAWVRMTAPVPRIRRTALAHSRIRGMLE